jgi:membrane protein implicated in regulation of membrane protease activity
MAIVGIGIGVFLAVIGLALFAFELAHPGAFLLIPGSILLVAGVMYLLFPNLLVDTVVGPAIVAVVALVAAVIELYYYQWLAPNHSPMTSMPSTFAGLEGLVIAPVVPDSLSGKVRVRSEIWSARSKTLIPAGTRVRILGGEGVSLEVVPLDAAPPGGTSAGTTA